MKQNVAQRHFYVECPYSCIWVMNKTYTVPAMTVRLASILHRYHLLVQWKGAVAALESSRSSTFSPISNEEWKHIILSIYPSPYLYGLKAGLKGAPKQVHLGLVQNFHGPRNVELASASILRLWLSWERYAISYPCVWCYRAIKRKEN